MNGQGQGTPRTWNRERWRASSTWQHPKWVSYPTISTMSTSSRGGNGVWWLLLAWFCPRTLPSRRMLVLGEKRASFHQSYVSNRTRGILNSEVGARACACKSRRSEDLLVSVRLCFECQKVLEAGQLTGPPRSCDSLSGCGNPSHLHWLNPPVWFNIGVLSSVKITYRINTSCRADLLAFTVNIAIICIDRTGQPLSLNHLEIFCTELFVRDSRSP